MTSWKIRLSLFKILNIHRGEEGRILSFFSLQVALSLVIGMISTAVDPIFIKHELDPAENLILGIFHIGKSFGHPPILQLSFLLYGFSSLLLILIGLLYTGVTDRVDKRKFFISALLLSFGVCATGGGLLIINDNFVRIPLLYSALFVWRFLIGILLLMIFWDITPFYFDARQGKRLFPLLAIGGAVGYAAGSIVIAFSSVIMPSSMVIFLIALFTLLCLFGFNLIKRNYSLLDSPRYREQSLLSEIREGFKTLGENPFLTAVGSNTVIFGLLSGLFIFTYNAVVNSRVSTSADAAGIMGLQRAGITILQALVLTKVMSQSSLGGKHKKEIATQIFFFILGIAAFAVSMVGVADFTRQIQIALMSPAAMAAFAFLPSRFRGRIMAINNLVAAPLGILVISIFVAFISPYVAPLWFMYPIGLLMIIRLIYNFILDRRYVKLLSENLNSGENLNLAQIDENISSILSDDRLLGNLLDEIKKQSVPIKTFVAGRLARSASTPQDIEKLRPFFLKSSDALTAIWIETLSRLAYEENEKTIRSGLLSDSSEIRIVSELAVLRHLQQKEKFEEFRKECERLIDRLESSPAERTDDFEEVITVLLRAESESGKRILFLDDGPLTSGQKKVFLSVLGLFPNSFHFPLIVEALHDEDFVPCAVSCLKRMPENFLLEQNQLLSAFPRKTQVFIIEELQKVHPEFSRRGAAGLMEAFFTDFQSADDTKGPDIGLVHSSMRHILDSSLVLLANPAPLPAGLLGGLNFMTEKLSKISPYLFTLYFGAEKKKAEKYFPLLRKLIEEELHSLLLLSLTFASLKLKKEEDRKIAYGICREMRDSVEKMQENALEFIDAKIESDMKDQLLVFFENLSVDEKAVRLRGRLRKFRVKFDKIIIDWHRYFLSADDDIAGGILEPFLPH